MFKFYGGDVFKEEYGSEKLAWTKLRNIWRAALMDVALDIILLPKLGGRSGSRVAVTLVHDVVVFEDDGK